MPDNNGNQEFYWQTARDSLLTASALSMFQIAARHAGESYEQSGQAIDQEYEIAQGRPPSQRHGGNFATYVRAFEEAGWMYLEGAESGRTIKITEAGRQALQLLGATPDLLKAVPYFLIELLSRYQLQNPAGPDTIRNRIIDSATKQSDVFPYWTIWKVMRSCDNRLTSDELRRFVFRLHRSEDIDHSIQQIREYRKDLEAGVSAQSLSDKYGDPIDGARGEPKYVMARAGTHIGKKLPLITKPNPSTYELNPVYFDLVDEVLATEPVFRDELDKDTWFRYYGEPVIIGTEALPFSLPADDPAARLSYTEVPDDDPVFRKVSSLIAVGARNILFVGPPGTSKTTYALRIGARLAKYQPDRFHNVQFHQSFGYEDFMEGYVPAHGVDTKAGFTLENKIFLAACDAARHDGQDVIHVLVIDELNRGDPSRIFGEALTYIERRDESFRRTYSGRRAVVPSNLIILATMNPFDKSIADLDMAMDRRFEKIRLDPDPTLLRVILEQNAMEPDLINKTIAFFVELTSEVENRIGQAYFKDAKDLASLKLAWTHLILPVLERELRYDQEKLARITDRFVGLTSGSPDSSVT